MILGIGTGARKTKVKTARRVRRIASNGPPICFFHVGKTGGTYIKSIIKKNGESSRNLVIVGHRATLAKTRREFGSDRRIAFMFRCPYERFVSAFYSRLRQGRPRNDSLWSAEEAVAYNWFKDANTLAECLFSANERERSAANFAMHAITHLKRNYTYHFHSVERLKNEADLIEFSVNTNNIDDKLPSIMNALGYEKFEMPRKRARHAALVKPPELSQLAKDNLREFWFNDFEIFDYLETIENLNNN